MTQRDLAAGRWAVRTSAVAVLLFGGGPALAHVELLPAMAGFLIFALGGLVGIGAAVLGIVALVRGAGARALPTTAAALIVALSFVALAVAARRYPPINDITTNTEHPPRFVTAPALTANWGRDMSYPGESFARQQRAGYPGLTGLPLPEPPDRAYGRLLSAAQAMPGWEVTRLDPAVHALEGVDTSWLFRFRDDFVIEVRAREQGSVVEMRSKSRDGRGDIGANAKRINTLFEKLR